MREHLDAQLKTRDYQQNRTLFAISILAFTFILSLLIAAFVSFFMISVLLSMLRPSQTPLVGITMIPISYILGIFTYHHYSRLREAINQRNDLQKDLRKLRFG